MTIGFPAERLASRGDAWISDELFDARVRQVPPEDRAAFIADPDRIAAVMGELLVISAVVNDARRSGLLADPDRAARLYLQGAGAVVQEMQAEVRARAELDSYEAQAREMYLRNPERYAVQPAVSFTQILFSDGDAPKARAEELLAQARDGRRLEELALEHSDDPTVADNQGKIESATHDRLDPQFLKGIETLETGELGLVESKYGWHVVRVDARQPARDRSFEEVREQLESRARRQHLQKAWENYLERVSAGEFEIRPDGVAGILRRHAPDLANPGEVADEAARAARETGTGISPQTGVDADADVTPEDSPR